MKILKRTGCSSQFLFWMSVNFAKYIATKGTCGTYSTCKFECQQEQIIPNLNSHGLERHFADEHWINLYSSTNFLMRGSVQVKSMLAKVRLCLFIKKIPCSLSLMNVAPRTYGCVCRKGWRGGVHTWGKQIIWLKSKILF